MTKKYCKPITIFLDQDGPLADFEKGALEARLSPEVAKMTPGFYLDLPVTPGALNAVERLNELSNVQIFVATKIPDKNPLAATEKIQWLHRHFPSIEERIIVTPNKACLGGPLDFLIDDRAHKADAAHFVGTFIHFASVQYPSWEHVLARVQRDLAFEGRGLFAN